MISTGKLRIKCILPFQFSLHRNQKPLLFSEFIGIIPKYYQWSSPNGNKWTNSLNIYRLKRVNTNTTEFAGVFIPFTACSRQGTPELPFVFTFFLFCCFLIDIESKESQWKHVINLIKWICAHMCRQCTDFMISFCSISLIHYLKKKTSPCRRFAFFHSKMEMF